MNTFNCSWPCGQNSNLITHRYSVCNIVVTETIYYTFSIDNINAYFNTETIGDHIRYARLKKGLYQKDLAKILGIHPCTINRYEKNLISPSKKNLQILSMFLDIDF